MLKQPISHSMKCTPSTVSISQRFMEWLCSRGSARIVRLSCCKRTGYPSESLLASSVGDSHWSVSSIPRDGSEWNHLGVVSCAEQAIQYATAVDRPYPKHSRNTKHERNQTDIPSQRVPAAPLIQSPQDAFFHRPSISPTKQGRFHRCRQPCASQFMSAFFDRTANNLKGYS